MPELKFVPLNLNLYFGLFNFNSFLGLSTNLGFFNFNGFLGFCFKLGFSFAAWDCNLKLFYSIWVKESFAQALCLGRLGEASGYRPGPLSLFVLSVSFFSDSSSEWDISEVSGGNLSNTLFGKALLSTRCCDCFSNLLFMFYNNGQQILFLNLSNLARVGVLILKRPGPCGWLRPTQFKPRLDWGGSAAQVRRYCVDSVAQAFVHALAGCVPRSLQYALYSLRNSRSAHFAAHALDVFATMSLLVSHNLYI